MFLTRETPRLEIIADKLSKVGWSCGCIEIMDHTRETFLSRMRMKKRTAFIELEGSISTCGIRRRLPMIADSPLF
jgi:hypothetical protein